MHPLGPPLFANGDLGAQRNRAMCPESQRKVSESGFKPGSVLLLLLELGRRGLCLVPC